jgi:serine/threonine protein kinase
MAIQQNEEKLRSKAARYITRKDAESNFFDKHAEDRIPKLEPREMSFGSLLGQGGFCTVTELKAVTLKSKDKEVCRNAPNLLQNRDYIASHVYRDGQARYAVKKVTATLYKKDQGSFLSGVVDLAMEAKYLALIQHPHIIKMRAVACTHFCSESFFIVLDRLYETLTDRITVWKEDVKKLSGLGKMMDFSGDKKGVKMAKRLSIAYDLCSALDHIHQNRLTYRDLKPDNIGFDVRDDVKVFDFGLAKEMHEKKRVGSTDTFKMTPKCGSPRYMAPEVFVGKAYNEKVDVYSFGLLLWQICQLKKPFSNFDYSMMEIRVVAQHERPLVSPKWSKTLQNLITSCWAPNMAERPSCDEIMTKLKAELINAFGADSAAINKLDITSRSDKSNN